MRIIVRQLVEELSDPDDRIYRPAGGSGLDSTQVHQAPVSCRDAQAALSWFHAVVPIARPEEFEIRTQAEFTLEELRYAEEVCFPEDAERLFQKYLGDVGTIYSYDFKHKYQGRLLQLIFNYSRADYDRGLGVAFDAILTELVAPLHRKGEGHA